MGADLDDTVIVPPRAPAPSSPNDIEDTVVSARVLYPDAAAPAPVDRASVEPATGSSVGLFAIRVGLAGEAIDMGAPVLIGRNPSLPRVVRGQSPRLVRVASPGREVSSTHLEVRQAGSTVVVTDLRSTNGSTVLVPGSTPRTLRQGESVVVSPGTLVDIGDDVIIQILPMNRTGRQP